MSLTLFALFALPFSLKMVLDPSGLHKMLKGWADNPTFQFVSAIVPMLMAALILSTSSVHFGWSWDSVLSWVAVVVALIGISHLFPSLIAWKYRMMTEERLPMFGFLMLLALLAMVYIDTQLL